MADWKVTMTRVVIVNGVAKSIQADHVVEGTSRQLAIPLGIDELFAREAANGYRLVAKEAVDYWRKARSGGAILYEVLSELENNWGLTFEIADDDDGPVREEPPVQVDRRSRNGHTPPADQAPPDLTAMLEGHLQLLTQRQGNLAEQLQRYQSEFDRNSADIMRITQVLTVLSPPLPTPIERVREKVQRKLAEKRKAKSANAE